jgi:hypothetical protein
MGNQDELDELNEEIVTDYAKIAKIIDEDSEPKSMAECRERLDWVQ